MKQFVRCLMVVAAMIAAMSVNAQSIVDYTFSTGTDATKWVTLTSYTDVSGTGSGDSWASTVRSIGFTFPFGESQYTQFSVNSDGNLRLGATATSSSYYTTPFSSSNSNQNSPKINFFGMDGYLVSGTHYVHSQLFGDTMLVVEYAMGCYSTNYRNNVYSWQVHLYSNGKIEVVFPDTEWPTLASTHQMGLCVNAADGLIVDNTNQAVPFTNGTTTNWPAAQHPAASAYYTFEPPVITCPRPTAIQASNLTPTSVTLTITPGGDETAWEGTISPAIMGYSTLVLPVSTLPLSMLTPNTDYTVSIRGICGVGDTSQARTYSFHTPCDLTDIPIYENFDSVTTSTITSTGVMPDCWTMVGPDASWTSSTQPMLYFGASHSGSYNLRLYYKGITALPGINQPVNGVQMNFWVKQTSAFYQLEVGVMTDVNDPTTFVAVDTIVNTNTSEFQYHEVYFNNYTGNGHYIAFHNITTNTYAYSYNYIDDIEIVALPTCPKPSAPVAVASTTSATVTWVLRDTAQNSFQLAYGSINDRDSMTIVNYTTNSTTLTSLNDNTIYYMYVRAICGDGDTSDWSEMGSFKTLCLTAASPIFVEDFEGLTGDEMPDCWMQGWYYQNPSIGAKTQPFKSSTTYKHSGARAMTLQDQGSGTHSFAYTQKLPIDRSGKYAVSIWVYRANSSSYHNEGIRVWMTPNGSDTTGGTMLGYIHRHYGYEPVEAAYGWHQYTFPIQNAGNQYVMIEGISEYGASTYFDDLEVYEMPCEKATDYAENFELQDNNKVPVCWDNTASTSTTLINSPQNIWGTYTYNGNKMMRMYNYYVQSGTAITNSPAVVLDSNNNELVFDYAHRANCGNVLVNISNDHGVTFTTVDTLTLNGSTSNADPGTFLTRSIDLTSYAGDTVIFQFSTNANYGYGSIFIDNIQIRQINNCPIPTDLAAAVSTASSIDVSWLGTAPEYILYYGTSTNTAEMDTLHVAGTSTTLTGLSFETTYNFFVKAVCDSASESYMSAMASAYTGYCIPTPSSVDGSGITNVTFGNGTETVVDNTVITSSPYYGNYSSMIGAVPAGTTANVDITFNTGYTYGTIIWVDWNNNLTFEGNEVVYVGESTNSSPSLLSASFLIDGAIDTGYYRMRIGAADSYYDSYTGSIAAAANANPCPASAYYTTVRDYTLHVTEAPACLGVLNVTSSNITTSSATITWTPMDTTQTAWSVAYGTVNDIDSMTILPCTTTNITLTGLTNGTTYYVAVKSVCSADAQSNWSSISSFATATCAAEDMCYVTVSMSDEYGDGWNGASLAIVDSISNITVATVTLNDGYSATDSIGVCPGRTYQLVWTSGMYDDEISFTLNDNQGTQLYSIAEPNSGIIYSFEATCINTVYYNVTALSSNPLQGIVNGGGTYEEGDTVTLVALPASTCHFTQWNDGDTNATRTFVVTSDTTFTAYFEYNPVTITLVNNDTTMGYTVPAAGTYTYQVGDNVNAMAYAYEGHQFANWTITVAGLYSDTSSFNPVAFVVPAMMAGMDVTVYANWTVNEYTVQAVSADTNMGTVTGSGVYTYGTTATIVATPAENHRFVSWNDGNTDATRTFVVTGDTLFTAYFISTSLTLELSVNDAEMGTTNPAPGTYTYQIGDTIRANAIAAEGYRFVEWQLTLMGSTSSWSHSNLELSIPSSVGGETMTAVAVFEQIPSYYLNVVVKDLEGNVGVGGTATGSGVYMAGTNVELTAQNHEGYYFAGFMTEEGLTLSTATTYTYTMPENNATIYAVFGLIVGIDNVDSDNINVYSQNSDIVVRGAENQMVRVFDVVGRMVAQRQAAGEEEHISVSQMGVYLVQVGNSAARRVVVR